MSLFAAAAKAQARRGAPAAAAARRHQRHSRGIANSTTHRLPMAGRGAAAAGRPRPAQASLAMVALALAVAAPVMAVPASALEASDLEECDRLFAEREHDGNLAKCLQKLKGMYADSTSDEERAELCFRISRICYNLLTSDDPANAELIDSKQKLTELASTAHKMAQEAVEIAPNDYRSHYWYGVTIQAVGDNGGGIKYKLQRIPDMRASFERAIELNPKDGNTLYCLGTLSFHLADINWATRKLIATLFATPPNATFEESLEFHLQAEKVDPNFWNKNPLMIAKAYEKLGNRQEAAKWAQETLDRPRFSRADERVAKEAEAVLSRTK